MELFVKDNDLPKNCETCNFHCNYENRALSNEYLCSLTGKSWLGETISSMECPLKSFENALRKEEIIKENNLKI
jgi:hypothetical protein